jgi:hypothetical protein
MKKIPPALLTVIFVAFAFSVTGIAPTLFPEWEQKFGAPVFGAIAAVAGGLLGCAGSRGDIVVRHSGFPS